MLLGVNYSGMHDAAVALLTETGELVSAVSEERLSRVKKDGRVPRRALDAVPWNDVDEIVVPYLADPPPFLGRDRLVDDLLIHTDRPVPPYPPKWRQQIESLPRPISYVDHHEAHAYAGFHLSGFAEALAITCDSGAYNCDSSLGVFHVNREGVSRLHAASFFCYESICRLYSDVTALLGFQPCVHEGKVTGLAAQGVPSQACRDALWDTHQQIRAHRLPLCMWVGFLDEGSPRLRRCPAIPQAAVAWGCALDYPDADVAAPPSIFEGVLLTIVERVAAEHGPRSPWRFPARVRKRQTQHGDRRAGISRGVGLPPDGRRGSGSRGARASSRAGASPACRRDARARARARDDVPGPPCNHRGGAAGIAQAGVKVSRLAPTSSPPWWIASPTPRRPPSPAAGRSSARGRWVTAGFPSTCWLSRWSTIGSTTKLDRTEFMPFAPVLRVENAHRSFGGAGGGGLLVDSAFMTVCMRARPEFTTVHLARRHIHGTARPRSSASQERLQWFRGRCCVGTEQLTGTAWALINTSSTCNAGADRLRSR